MPESAPADLQFYRDRVSYLQKELAYYQQQVRNAAQVEKATVFIDPDAFTNITRVVSELLQQDDLDAIYRAIVHAIRDIWGYTRIGLLRVNETERTLEHAYGFGLPQHYYDTLKIPLVAQAGMAMRAVAARCVLEKRPILVADRASDPDYRARFDDDHAHKEYSHQFLMIPLLGRARVWGALTVATDESEPNFLTTNSVEVLQFFANQATLAVENFHFRRELAREHEKLRRYAVELENSNRLKIDFLNNMSHELRTPLAPIVGYADLLQQARDLNPEQRQIVGRIANSASRLVYLIEDLMDLAQLSAGRIAMNIQPVDVHEIIAAVLETVQPLAWQRNLKITVPARGEECLVAADPNRAIQVLWNVLTNAVKFSPNDSEITVALEPRADCVELLVSDRGIGIAPENLGIIFERFRQLDGSSTRQFGGVGLGLDLARTLAELQGGSIRAASDGPGRGSTFTVTFRRSTRGKTAAAAARSLPLPDRLDLQGRTVLVVEDDPATLEMVTALVSEVNGNCKWCVNGSEAAAAFRVNQPDLILLDIALPEKDGFAILAELRAAMGERKVPVVAMTAFVTGDNVAKLNDSPFDDYLFKPFSLREFYRTLAGAVAPD